MSIRPEYHEKLIRLAHYQNRTITTVVNELLNECEVAVDLMLNAYEEIEKGVDQQKSFNKYACRWIWNFSDKLKQD